MGTTYHAWSLLAYIAASSALPAAQTETTLSPANTNRTDIANLPNAYCTFYADDECSQKVGDVPFNIYNEGCFANSGGYIFCKAAGGIEPPFIIVQSPDDNANCYCQTDCLTFADLAETRQPYKRCTANDLNPQYQTFRIEHEKASLPANNC